MNEERQERRHKLRVGVFVLIGLAAFLGMIYALGARARLFEARYTIHAEFNEVGGLVEGATVRLAGVQIGRVTGVRLPPEPGGRVRVDLTIGRQFANRVRKDSVARLETQGLLGDKIVELSVGTRGGGRRQVRRHHRLAGIARHRPGDGPERSGGQERERAGREPARDRAEAEPVGADRGSGRHGGFGPQGHRPGRARGDRGRARQGLGARHRLRGASGAAAAERGDRHDAEPARARAARGRRGGRARVAGVHRVGQAIRGRAGSAEPRGGAAVAGGRRAARAALRSQVSRAARRRRGWWPTTCGTSRIGWPAGAARWARC